MNEIDPVERELSKAGNISPATTMTCRLEENRITLHMDLPQMELLFRYNGIPCFFRGELTGGVVLALSYECKVMKPKREIFDIMLRGQQWLPEETVFVDDGLRNVETAAAMGMQTLCPQNNEDWITRSTPSS